MSFKGQEKAHQIKWWQSYSNQQNWASQENKWGTYNKKHYSHIVKGGWNQLLWKGIQTQLPQYLGMNIQAHSSSNNLLSSWVLAANLYFPTRVIPEFKDLLLGFLKAKVSNYIVKINEVELEFAHKGKLSPKNLLGEMDGSRGSGQTSPDVAFIVETRKGKGLILTECKYTEHSFYACSARRKTDRGNKPGNPNPSNCLQPANSCDYIKIPCQQKVWGRKYLDNFLLSSLGKKSLKRCPAATNGYQMVRQQALANAILKNGDYELVVSAVSFDRRNTPLIKCMRTTGINDFQTGWPLIYDHGAGFKSWHHQEWVEHVRNYHSNTGEELDWLDYMGGRYGY